MNEVLRRHADAEERENHRAGLIAAMIANANRKKGRPLVRPGDFFRKKSGERMAPEEAVSFMDSWAAAVSQNAEKNRDRKGRAKR